MRFSEITIACLLALSTLSLTSYAQSGSIDLPSVGESSVVIINQGNTALGFSIRPYGGEWSNYNVASGSNIKISCSNCTTDGFEINLSTGSRSVKYNLPAGERFALAWNYSAGLWDVFKVPS